MAPQLLFLMTLVIAIAAKEKGEACTTPKGDPGQCVPLNTCQSVFNAIATTNTSGFGFAIKSYCAYHNEPYVCCQSPGPVIVPNFNTKALPDKTLCGVTRDESRIFGGKTTDLGELPWMVAIIYQSKNTSELVGMRCAGSLISNRHVLTSAHCLKKLDLDPVAVSLGDWQLSTDPDCTTFIANTECADPIKYISIKKVIPHALFSRKLWYNDIGLLLLEEEVQFTDFISPICLPFPQLPPPAHGTYMTVAGWGWKKYGELSDVLRKVELPVVSNRKCQPRVEQVNVSFQQLCAGGESGKDTCDADGGAPLMRIYEDKPSGRLQWYQDGLVSLGLAECGSKVPGIYTRVSSYMDWIINIISED